MQFRNQVLVEAVFRYIITFGAVATLYPSLSDGLNNAAETGKLEAIAVIMGIVSLCSLTGYFSFSYTVVGKTFWSRMWGYVCAFGLTLPLILCWLVLFQISCIWIPELTHLWAVILGTLYMGIFVFDLIDLMRMGLDIAATNFFEQSVTAQSSEEERFETLVSSISEGKRLPEATELIGAALEELGKFIQDREIAKTGEWIHRNPHLSQQTVDLKIVDLFTPFCGDEKIRESLAALQLGQSQQVADSLIVELLRYVKNGHHLKASLGAKAANQ